MMLRGEEWFCEHNIGHYVDGSAHGCDGCCHPGGGALKVQRAIEIIAEVLQIPNDDADAEYGVDLERLYWSIHYNFGAPTPIVLAATVMQEKAERLRSEALDLAIAAGRLWQRANR